MQLLKFEELFYSTVSIAELGYKTSLGKLSFGVADIEGWQKFGMNELPFGRQAATEFANVPAHLVPDPMDRQILATARANDLALLTSDRRILELDFDWLLDATT
jgi:PIN domain nuclease of toxin-antitoxin system